jgi:hypothetical protein
LCSPTQNYDKNGRWATDADNPSGGRRYTAIEVMINDFAYNMCVEKGATTIASYIENNTIYARFKNFSSEKLEGRIKKGEPILDENGNISSIQDCLELDSKNNKNTVKCVSTVVHEVSHLKGENEFGAFAAEYAFGGLSDRQIIGLFQNSKDSVTVTDENGNSNRIPAFEYAKQGLPEDVFSQFFTGENKTITDNETQQGLFLQIFSNYGSLILGKGLEIEQ